MTAPSSRLSLDRFQFRFTDPHGPGDTSALVGGLDSSRDESSSPAALGVEEQEGAGSGQRGYPAWFLEENWASDRAIEVQPLSCSLGRRHQNYSFGVTASLGAAGFGPAAAGGASGCFAVAGSALP